MQRVGVVGGGLMGAGIAEVVARADLDVVLVESSAGAARVALDRIEASVDRAVATGRVADKQAVLGRIRTSASLADLEDRELVVEAIVEDEAAKVELFATLDKVVQEPTAILASNTSSIPIMKLGMVTSRPQQVVGVHFFNPVPVLRLVELVPSLLTSEDTKARARGFVEGRLGKSVIESQDRAGFIVNALLVPYLLSAVRMLESGFATKEDIDTGMKLGAAHPQGPLALADLIGLDTVKAIADSLYTEFKESQYASPPLLGRMVDAGLLGRKSGRGFLNYE